MGVKTKTRQLAENLLKKLLSEDGEMSDFDRGEYENGRPPVSAPRHAPPAEVPAAASPEGGEGEGSEDAPEDVNSLDFYELIDKLADKRGWHHPNEQTIEELAEVLGYHGLDEFFSDNPGACSAIIEWVQQLHSVDDKWRSGVLDALAEEGDDAAERPRY